MNSSTHLHLQHCIKDNKSQDFLCQGQYLCMEYLCMHAKQKARLYHQLIKKVKENEGHICNNTSAHVAFSSFLRIYLQCWEELLCMHPSTSTLPHPSTITNPDKGSTLSSVCINNSPLIQTQRKRFMEKFHQIFKSNDTWIIYFKTFNWHLSFFFIFLYYVISLAISIFIFTL